MAWPPALPSRVARADANKRTIQDWLGPARGLRLAMAGSDSEGAEPQRARPRQHPGGHGQHEQGPARGLRLAVPSSGSRVAGLQHARGRLRAVGHEHDERGPARGLRLVAGSSGLTHCLGLREDCELPARLPDIKAPNGRPLPDPVGLRSGSCAASSTRLRATRRSSTNASSGRRCSNASRSWARPRRAG